MKLGSKISKKSRSDSVGHEMTPAFSLPDLSSSYHTAGILHMHDVGLHLSGWFTPSWTNPCSPGSTLPPSGSQYLLHRADESSSQISRTKRAVQWHEPNSQALVLTPFHRDFPLSLVTPPKRGAGKGNRFDVQSPRCAYI